MVDDRVWAGAKVRAAQDGRSLSNVIEEFLASYGGRPKKEDQPERWVLPVLGQGQPLPDIDWTSNSAIWDCLEGDLPLEKQR